MRNPSDIFDEFVAPRMAVLIVDLLEAMNVERNSGHYAAGAIDEIQDGHGSLVKAASVQGAGEVVVERDSAAMSAVVPKHGA